MAEKGEGFNFKENSYKLDVKSNVYVYTMSIYEYSRFPVNVN